MSFPSHSSLIHQSTRIFSPASLASTRSFLLTSLRPHLLPPAPTSNRSVRKEKRSSLNAFSWLFVLVAISEGRMGYTCLFTVGTSVENFKLQYLILLLFILEVLAIFWAGHYTKLYTYLFTSTIRYCRKITLRNPRYDTKRIFINSFN